MLNVNTRVYYTWFSQHYWLVLLCKLLIIQQTHNKTFAVKREKEHLKRSCCHLILLSLCQWFRHQKRNYISMKNMRGPHAWNSLTDVTCCASTITYLNGFSFLYLCLFKQIKGSSVAPISAWTPSVEPKHGTGCQHTTNHLYYYCSITNMCRKKKIPELVKHIGLSIIYSVEHWMENPTASESVKGPYWVDRIE